MSKVRDEYDILCSTKKSREGLAKAVEDLASLLGCTVTRSDRDSRCVSIRLYKGPYSVGMSFDGGLRGTCFIGHWNTDGDAVFPREFGAVVRGSINTVHYHKATTICVRFDVFLDMIQAGFEYLELEQVHD